MKIYITTAFERFELESDTTTIPDTVSLVNGAKKGNLPFISFQSAMGEVTVRTEDLRSVRVVK